MTDAPMPNPHAVAYYSKARGEYVAPWKWQLASETDKAHRRHYWCVNCEEYPTQGPEQRCPVCGPEEA